jgi:hypothetical protein
MNTSTTHIPPNDSQLGLRSHREEIVELLQLIEGEHPRILDDESPARRCDLFHVEFVVDSPHLVDLMKVLNVEARLERLLGLRVFVHHLAYDCEYHRVVRKDSVSI